MTYGGHIRVFKYGVEKNLIDTINAKINMKVRLMRGTRLDSGSVKPSLSLGILMVCGVSHPTPLDKEKMSLG